MSDKRCGTCKWWKHPDPWGRCKGFCKWPLPPKMPCWAYGSSNATDQGAGGSCDCYEPKKGARA